MWIILVEIGLLALLIILNGVFAMSEIAVLSAREAPLRQRAENGSVGARTALKLRSSPNRFLSTIQVGITLVGILVGALSGATFAGVLADAISQVRFLAPYAEALAVGAVVVVITYLTLVFGELVPKRLAMNDPEGISAAIARPMEWLSRLTAPVVRLLSVSTEGVLALLGVRPSGEPPVTEDDIRLMVRRGVRFGILETIEQDMVERVFNLDDIRTSLLMTPRTEIVWLDIQAPNETNWRKVAASGFSTFPVCDGTLDQILGLVSVKQLWTQHVTGQSLDLRTLLIEPVFVPENTPALNTLQRLKQIGYKQALVVDEFGGIDGMVTLNDLLEAIVGDIQERDEGPAPEAIQRDDGSWLIDARLPAWKLKDLLGLKVLPGEEDRRFETVGGFVMMALGRVPREADYFEVGGLRFEVVDMDEHRVDKVLVSPSAKITPDA